MEAELTTNYHVGQYVQAYIDTEWTPSVVTSVQKTDPPQYGIISIKKNRNFFLTADSLRRQPDRVLVLADDSLDDSASGEALELAEQVNFSIVSSDDETLFITPSNIVEHSDSHSSSDDSFSEFTKDAQDLLTLSSPARREDAVNGSQHEGSPGADSHEGFVNSVNITPDDCVEAEVSEKNPQVDVDIELFNKLLDTEFEEIGEDVNPPRPPSPQPQNMAEKKASVRFAEVDDGEMAELQRASKSHRTNKQTSWGVKILQDWMRSKGRKDDFGYLPEKELGVLLKNFYASARTKEGELYSKASIQCIRAAVQRFLQAPPYNRAVNLIAGPEFIQANDVIKGMIKQMRIEGKDKSTRHTPINTDDMKRLYESGAFSQTTPTTLQFKVFFEIVFHFGRRGREGLRQLKTEMISIEKDAQGRQYATLNCQPHEKNHPGSGSHAIEHVQRMYETKQSSCPIVSLKSYLSHLNPDSEWFFQRPKVSNFEGKVLWYIASPMGENAISTLMVKISASANLSRRYTNHCIRATTVTTLREAGVAPNDIASVTGHRSLASIDHYSRVSEETRCAMSNELAAVCSPIKKSPRRSLITERYSRATTVISTPAKKCLAKLDDRLTTVTVETDKTVEEASELAKNILTGAVFNGPVTLNFTIK